MFFSCGQAVGTDHEFEVRAPILRDLSGRPTSGDVAATVE